MNSSNLLARVGRWSGVALLSASLLSACGGGGGGSEPPVQTPNRAPVAAFSLTGMISPGGNGSDATAVAGSQIALNAGESKDADGDAMTYAWTMVSKPATSNLVLAAPASAQLSLTPDVAGDYILNVKVSDPKGAFSEKKATITITGNQAPVTNVSVKATFTAVAAVMPTQALTVGAAVVMDAAGSTDADGDAVTVAWDMMDKPAGSSAALVINGSVARFTADAKGVFKVRARGSDARGSYSETIYVFDANNRAPQTVLVSAATNPAEADGQSVISASTGYIVSLNGADSIDADGDALVYAWTVVSKPAASAAALDNASGSTTQISPDVLGDYVVKLTATDPRGSHSSHLTTINVTNRRPLAAIAGNATPVALAQGPTMRMPVNTIVTLRGNGSVDADGDALTYKWTVVSKPAGSAAVLSAADTVAVQITPDVAGQYQMSLRVTDSAGAFSEQTMNLAIGNWAPVAVVDRVSISDSLGATVVASAARSYDDDYDPLTYTWEIDARPAGSTAAVGTPNGVKLSFVPDVAGIYVASVTVSDGRNSSVAYVTINAVSAQASAFELGFKPGITRYSRSVDKLVSVASGPDTLYILNPFTGTSKNVALSGAGQSLSLSPDGKLAAVLQPGSLMLVDLVSATVIHSTALISTHTDVVVNDAGLAYLFGGQNTVPAAAAVQVLNAKTGADLTATHGWYETGFATSPGAGANSVVLSAVNKRIYVYTAAFPNTLKYVNLDGTTGAVVSSGTYSTQTNNPGSMLFENETVLIQGMSFMKADTLADLGMISGVFGPLDSFSNSSSADESILTFNGPRFRTTGGVYAGYNNYVNRYNGQMVAASSLMMPQVGGKSSYAVFAAHSANNRYVLIGQTMTDEINGIGAKYYVITIMR